MPRGKRDRDTARLRLASARRRVHAFLNEISSLENSEFAYSDARYALREIKRRFLELLDRTRLPDSTSLGTINGVCLDISRDIEEYTAILGFLLRSTNVRNAFELHSPLSSLVHKVAGDGTKLVISSEWDFVPFTYPMNLAVLSDVVLVGGPATESSNAFLTPLAGHEIGHSAWRSKDIAALLSKALASEISTALRAAPTVRARIRRAIGPGYDGALMEFAGPQLEEIFCDAFGLFVFAEAYAYAYQYVMMPGGLERSLTYPSDEDRIRYIQEAAQWYGVSLPDSLFLRWRPSKPLGGLEGDIISIADVAVRAVAPLAWEHAARILTDAKIGLPTSKHVERIHSCFMRNVPDDRGGTLAEIVSAGWRRVRELGGMATRHELGSLATLNEIMLKSVEVAEYRERTRLC